MRKKDAEDPGYNLFLCLLCPKDGDGSCPTFEAGNFKPHLSEHHPEFVNEQGSVPGNRRMSTHLDGRTWHETRYTWSANGKDIAAQWIRQPRARNDPMRF